jgi:hypothetical protein
MNIKSNRIESNYLDLIDDHSPCNWNRVKVKRDYKLENGDKVLAFDVGQIHMAECILEVDLSIRPPMKVLQWNMMNLGGGKVSNTVINLCREAAESKGYWKDCKYIVIEQQDRVNTKMVAVSHALEAVLIMMGCSVPVFASAPNKFSVFSTMRYMHESIIQTESKELSKYKKKRIRKQNSIRLVQSIISGLNHREKLTKQLNNLKSDEKDDLADAFVYAAGFIYKNEPHIITKTMAPLASSSCSSSAFASCSF